ncbi:MAG TPA: adenylate kinase [Candidatus Acidoferrales bacterium]|nr:adenylate kinase [Candidatus Acidoferrales bacterium]
MALKRALIFLGPPGAGKGTQAKRVAQRYGVQHLSTGDMLRAAIARRTSVGHMARPIMERGELVPDEIVLAMVEERLSQPDCANGFVFDGFPRTLPQARELDRILERHGWGEPLVVDFEVPAEVLIRRLSGRWTCSVGGEIYNVFDRPPKQQGVCDADGGKLVQRPDDRPEVVRDRLVAYERQTKPLAEYYRQNGNLNVVDGSATMEDVDRAVARILSGAEG